jgi:O-acetyl-ADP-ribose deacetylase (regulator of RNase III)
MFNCVECGNGPCDGYCKYNREPSITPMNKLTPDQIMRDHPHEWNGTNYLEVSGDLIKLALNAKFDVIAHGCNCRSNMGAGLAPQMAKAFKVNRFEMENWGPNINKLGCIDYQTFVLGENAVWSLEDGKNNRNEPELTVVNAYTQHNYGKNHADGNKKPVDYEAITLCMRKMNVEFKGKHIGLPKIGAGLAGGNWDKIKEIIKRELKDCRVTIVNYVP